MKENIFAGDIVESIAGRDKGLSFLVVSVKGNRAYLIDGKNHKVNKPKIKNIKHIKLILVGEGKTFSDKINEGKPTGNIKVFRYIKACTKKAGGKFSV